MSSLINHLQAFGLTAKQAELYIAVVKHGARPASFLAKICKTERTNTYKTAMTLVEKGILGQADHHGTTVFFAPDKEIFRKQTDYATKKLEEQEKRLPELEQALLQLETATNSPIPKMRFYQWINGIQTCYEQLTEDIFDSWLLQIKCFATNTIASQGIANDCIIYQRQLHTTLEKHHIGIDMTLANGINLLEDIVKTKDAGILTDLPTGNNALHLYIIKNTLYIFIYKAIPVALQIESEELSEVLFFLLKQMK